ncbi:hypothetical protein FRB91_009737 [Serendipita sp. 411]|nr:hypothetical protein FRC18_011638 [Serendipita sp. 400]KAG8849608.1 hypothetical protein FRB91_009737 [Serendipita sp. 411]
MSYEIVLTGTLPSADEQLLKDVQNRLSLHTDSSMPLHRIDYEFELETIPQVAGLSTIRASGPNERAILRAKRDLTATEGNSPGSEWTLHTYIRPIRKYTRAIVRPCTSIPLLSGDAITFASAMGYRLVSMTTRKGYLFTKGVTSISLYQTVASSGRSYVPNQDIWQIEVMHNITIALPSKTKHVPDDFYLQHGVDVVLSVALLMKGLVDLLPPE